MQKIRMPQRRLNVINIAHSVIGERMRMLMKLNANYHRMHVGCVDQTKQNNIPKPIVHSPLGSSQI